MSTPDPEGMTLLAKIAGAATAVGAPFLAMWKMLDKKADKNTVANTFQEVKSELSLHRGYFKDVFEQMREMESKASDRHVELLEKIHEGRK